MTKGYNDSEIERIRHGLMEALGRAAGVWGINETIGRLYGLLYLSDEALGLDEMARELAVSKATISINIRTLERFKCVQKVWQKGSRKDYYVVERDFEKIFQEALRTSAADELAIFKQGLQTAIADYESLLGGASSGGTLHDEAEAGEGVRGEALREQARRDLEKLQFLTTWIQTGERWLNFFLKAEIAEGPEAGLQRIQVEWEDES